MDYKERFAFKNRSNLLNSIWWTVEKIDQGKKSALAQVIT